MVGTFCDGMVSDGTFSDGMISDGTFSDRTFLYGNHSKVQCGRALHEKEYSVFLGITLNPNLNLGTF